MADLPTTSDFTVAVEEYRTKQKDTMRTFIYNVCELGEILAKHRDVFKADGQWMSYLKEIDVHISNANAQIRLFEYVQKTQKKDVLAGVITNWAKMNLFLSLEEDQKERLLADADGTETSEEFRGKVADVRGEDISVSDEDEDLLIRQLQEIGGVAMVLTDPVATAKTLLPELGLSNAALPAVEGLLYIVKGIEQLKNTTVPEADRKILEGLVKEQQAATASISLPTPITLSE